MLVAAGPPEEDLEVTLDDILQIEEAVLSFVRAALAAKYRVVVIADPALSALAAAVAGEYADAERAEQRRVPPSVEIVERRDHDDDSPLDGLPGVGRIDADGDPGQVARQREAIAFMAIGHVSPVALRSLMDIELVPGMVPSTIPRAVLAELHSRAVREADVAGREQEALSVIADEPGPLPLPFLMQRFVANWPGGEDEPDRRERSLAR